MKISVAKVSRRVPKIFLMELHAEMSVQRLTKGFLILTEKSACSRDSLLPSGVEQKRDPGNEVYCKCNVVLIKSLLHVYSSVTLL